MIARKYGLPIYATPGTIQAIKKSRSVGTIDEGLFHPIAAGECFEVGGLTIEAMHISHDAAEPVAYFVASRGKRIGVVTDLGCYDERIVEKMQGLDALLLEANHDIHMLQVGGYPYPLKQRILGDKGHLSNECCGQLLGSILHDHMKHILLGHLSRENNYPELAFVTVQQEITLGDNPYRANDFPIEVAERRWCFSPDYGIGTAEKEKIRRSIRAGKKRGKNHGKHIRKDGYHSGRKRYSGNYRKDLYVSGKQSYQCAGYFTDYCFRFFQYDDDSGCERF